MNRGITPHPHCGTQPLREALLAAAALVAVLALIGTIGCLAGIASLADLPWVLGGAFTGSLTVALVRGAKQRPGA
jgi:hypothetical protein